MSSSSSLASSAGSRAPAWAASSRRRPQDPLPDGGAVAGVVWVEELGGGALEGAAEACAAARERRDRLEQREELGPRLMLARDAPSNQARARVGVLE